MFSHFKSTDIVPNKETQIYSNDIHRYKYTVIDIDYTHSNNPYSNSPSDRVLLDFHCLATTDSWLNTNSSSSSLSDKSTIYNFIGQRETEKQRETDKDRRIYSRQRCRQRWR